MRVEGRVRRRGRQSRMNGVRSLYRTARLAAAVMILLAGCTPSKAGLYEDERAFAELVLSALSVAHPDYSFSPAPTHERRTDGLSVTLTAHPIGAFMAGDVGTVTVSVVYDQNTRVTRVSSLPKTRLGRVLKLLGTSKESGRAMQDTRELLSNMGSSVEVVAVAELAEPMSDSAVLRDDSRLAQPQRVLLSPGGGELLLGNSLYCGRTCDGHSYAASFQEWVSTLQPQDQPTLKAFGLNLSSLRAAAQQSKIYSTIYENYDAETLLKISKDPKVRALYVADVNLKCASDTAALCEPARNWRVFRMGVTCVSVSRWLGDGCSRGGAIPEG
ncbi:hypothetical protein ACTMTI_53290 [Nonomuraea sp. H19]|uniref:hypothetical protein n=1 Tax=Nonomuraea sp. H19 TaxID=3452206 RepID=UPI003F8B051B